jgi:HK97 family phage prohead protease
MSEDLTRKTFDAEVKAVGDRTMRFVISTSEADRDNDTIAPRGWKLGNYRKNPVVLWAHDVRQLPVARCVDVRVEDEKLVAMAEFPAREIFEFGATVFDLLKGGFLRATSVGFKPLKFVRNAERNGMDFLEQELVEFSICNVPSNPNTLALRGFDDARFKAWLGAAGTPENPPAADRIVLELRADDDLIVIELADPLPDPAARHHQFHAGELIEVDRAELRRAMAGVLAGVVADTRSGLGEVVAREVNNAMNRARGRVD